MKSAKRRSARGVKRKRRSTASTTVTVETRTTMLTSVDQVRETIGVTPALVLADMSTAVKRAAVDHLSVLPGVTARSNATARSLDMVAASRTMAVKSRTGMKVRVMAATLETLAASSLGMVLTLIALADTVVKKSQDTVVKTTMVVLMGRVTANRATAARSLTLLVDMAALKAANTVASNLSDPTVLREFLAVLVAKTSMGREGKSMVLAGMVVAAVDMEMRGTEGDTK